MNEEEENDRSQHLPDAGIIMSTSQNIILRNSYTVFLENVWIYIIQEKRKYVQYDELYYLWVHK